MPANITLKNIPDELYEKLKISADFNRRSINIEAVFLFRTGVIFRSYFCRRAA